MHQEKSFRSKIFGMQSDYQLWSMNKQHVASQLFQDQLEGNLAQTSGAAEPWLARSRGMLELDKRPPRPFYITWIL
jgi:hypothetical protein